MFKEIKCGQWVCKKVEMLSQSAVRNLYLQRARLPLSVNQKFETVSKAMLGNLARDEVEITKGLP